MVEMTRKQKLAAIWKNTHKDYKGKLDGVKGILVLRNVGTTIVNLEDLTDAEIEDRMQGIYKKMNKA